MNTPIDQEEPYYLGELLATTHTYLCLSVAQKKEPIVDYVHVYTLHELTTCIYLQCTMCVCRTHTLFHGGYCMKGALYVTTCPGHVQSPCDMQ